MRFKSVNEQGLLYRVQHKQPVFHFTYENDFYGSCSFLAEIEESDNETLNLDETSLQVEDYQIKNGSLTVLVETAKIFLKGRLKQHSRLRQLDNPVARITTNLLQWGQRQ
jgi:hypothetical protein